MKILSKQSLFSILGVCLLNFPALDAKPETPRLSPQPENISTEKVALGGEWKFNPAPPSEFWNSSDQKGWKPIQVPGEWVMQGFNVAKGVEAGYQRTFTLPESWKGRRVKLRCNGIYSQSRIHINGKEVGSHLGGFTPFEFDVTNLVETGKEQSISIAVLSDSIADGVASGTKYAVHPLGGITRDIYLFSLAEVNISQFHYKTSFDKNYTDAQLTVQMGIANESAQAQKGVLVEWVLTDPDGKKTKLGEKPLEELPAQSTFAFDMDFAIKSPRQWNPEHPWLYRLTTTLSKENVVLESTERKVGFRQIEVRGNEVFVNNRPIKLRGVNRHEVMPRRGRSLTGDIWKQDVEIFKQGNVNYIRTCHYPPDEALLDACDELGMFVEVEAPFCWAHETEVSEDKRMETFTKQHLEMVNRDRSHPSVLMWSLGNESNKYEEYFQKSGMLIKEIDPTRPRIFSQWSPNADKEELEIGNHHYPGPGGPQQYKDSKRPIVFDEYCHLNAYNRLELAADPGLRAMWGDLLVEMWDNMYQSKGVLGGALWSGIDDTFFLPDNQAVGYGTWGPVDGWRRLKPEYYGMKHAYNPIQVTLLGNRTPEGKITLKVENRQDFTNLQSCAIEWQAGSEKGTLTPDIAPRSQQEITLTLPPAALKEQNINIRTLDAQKMITGESVFPLAPECEKVASAPLQPVLCEETKTHYLVKNGNKVYSIDKSNGLFEIASDKVKTTVVSSPSLMILPLNGEGHGIQMVGKDQNFTPYNPVCAQWQADSVTVKEGDQGVTVKVEGSYQEAEGSFTYHFLRNGEVKISYDFTLLKDISPRQTGLVFTLDETFTTLEWKRKKENIVYPETYINALQGKAEAFEESRPLVGIAGPADAPSWKWHLDQTAAGSNHFRSTKTDISKAILSSKALKKGLTVKSEGKQHLRCWKENKQIKMLVADYNNPGTENFLRPHAALKDKPLKAGTQISGSVLMSIE